VQDGVYVAIDLFAVNLYASPSAAAADAGAGARALLGACTEGLVSLSVSQSVTQNTHARAQAPTD
jgi:hypothetical protein